MSHKNAVNSCLSYPENAFQRLDESDDREFYRRDRMVAHLDRKALETVESVVGQLIVEERPAILDLMASWDSHLPQGLSTSLVVGLGLNPAELAANPRLDRRVVQDLNREPRLPFGDSCFDVVINTVSVDYLTCPFEVFAEVGRVLKPGGLSLVVFSHRFFPEKVVRVWRESSEEERLILVEEYFNSTGLFDSPRLFLSKGLPRPKDDKYAGLGLPSDPIFAVYANRKGKTVLRPVPRLDLGVPSGDELSRRKASVSRTLRCPYCGARLKKWRVPDNPFTEWNTDHMLVCMNDGCPYLLAGFSEMGRQGNIGASYRLMYNPVGGALLPAPVPNLQAMKDGIMEDE